MQKIHQRIKNSILFMVDLLYPLFKRFMSLQTFRYAACGGVNTLLDIGLFALNYHLIFKKHNVTLGAIILSPHIASLWLAFCITLPVGFYLNRYVVFQQSGLRRRSQLFRYLLVTFICMALNYVLLKLFVDYLGWYPTPSKILTTAIVVVVSYTSQTFFFFKTKEPVDMMG
ncbi:GtrA family protein [Mucilaginibacter sp.]|jgi:putative flippase GtrA|uniref:GtrA family protein n=1 Tax=Mucilaginibacter sp. TaxID=1882438 RepID=UPI00260A5B6B|nr:GtrA family protein [Mucilaginibacter sp.]